MLQCKQNNGQSPLPNLCVRMYLQQTHTLEPNEPHYHIKLICLGCRPDSSRPSGWPEPDERETMASRRAPPSNWSSRLFLLFFTFV